MIRRLFMKAAASVPLLIAAMEAHADRIAPVPPWPFNPHSTVNSSGLQDGIALHSIAHPDTRPFELRELSEWFEETFECHEGIKRSHFHNPYNGSIHQYMVFAIVADDATDATRAQLIEAFKRGFVHAENCCAQELKTDNVRLPLFWRNETTISVADVHEFEDEFNIGHASQPGRKIGERLSIRARLSIPDIEHLLKKLDTFCDDGVLPKHISEVLV